MKINEIISAVAYANVKDGSQLATHYVAGLRVSSLDTAAIEAGGVYMLVAQIFETYLLEVFQDPTEIDAYFFRRLHEEVLKFANDMIDGGSCVEDWEEEVWKFHDPSIEKVRTLAREHGVTYEEPPKMFRD